ncbi:MAG: hypothetical protein ACYDAL_04720 [Candidatus Dormibacteraceae bacterium]
MATQLLAIWAILRKDLALTLRRPVVILVTILPPLVVLLVLVLEAASVTAEPVAVVNGDPGCEAARALQRNATDFDGFHTSVESAAAAARDYVNLRVAAVFTIPKGFCAALAVSQQPAIGWQVHNFTPTPRTISSAASPMSSPASSTVGPQALTPSTSP